MHVSLCQQSRDWSESVNVMESDTLLALLGLFFWALASGCLSSLLEPVLEVLKDWHNCEFRLRIPKLHDQVMDFLFGRVWFP